MNVEEIYEYVLNKNNVIACFPFGNETLVFKVNQKIFLLIALDETPLKINVKCKPEDAVLLREQYPNTILPGYHMNKKHWNTIIINGEVPLSNIKCFIDNSYNLVSGKKA
jgi:predicted DNA-binding protein (MmcQ/YjbR family)